MYHDRTDGLASASKSVFVIQMRPGWPPGAVVVAKSKSQPTLHSAGYGGNATETAMPETRSERPFSAMVCPGLTPRAAAKLRSSTTAPGRAQVPAVSSGRSTADAAWSRPSVMAGTV
jgi:hypothetical protein